MDQHDSKTSGVANSFTNFHSPEMPDPIGKAKSSSDSHEVISDGCTGLDRKKHSSVSDHEVNCCESAQSAAAERTSLTHDHRSSLYCSKDKADDSMLFSSFSSSCSELVKENVAEVSCRVTSGNGNQDISMKSDVSVDNGQNPDRERDELVDRKMKENWLQDEDSSKSVVAPCHCKQLETESMSSNATPVIVPASSNDSCQGTSANANSCDRCKHSGTKTCTSIDFKYSPEGSGVKSSVQVVDTQNASQYGVHLTGCSPGNISHLDNCLKIVDSAGTRCDKPLEMITDSNLVIAEKSELQESKSFEKENGGFPEIKPCFELNNAPEVAQRIARDVAPEVGTYREASGSCSSSMQGRSDETSHMSSVDSAVLDKDCSTETGSKSHLGNALDSFCLEKDEFDLKMSIRSLDTNDTSKNKDHQEKHGDNVGLHGRGSSPTDSEYLTAIHKHNFVSRFDLNEKIVSEEVDYPKLSIKETASFHAPILSKPIPMVAKSGISVGLPTYGMQLHEASGWKGSAATSAFRATFPRCMSSRIVASPAMDVSNNLEFLQPDRIDLNIAAEGGDCDMEFLVEKHVQAFSSFPAKQSSIVSTSRAENFNFDLNCVGVDDDNSHQLCLPASSLTNATKGFDLNFNPISADESGDPCPSVQRDGESGDSVFTFLRNVQKSEANSGSPAYHVDLNSLQRFNHSQATSLLMDAPTFLPPREQIRNAVSMQPRQTYTSYPPQTLLCNNAFFIDPNSRLSSSVYAPGAISYNVTNPKETCFFPQMVGSVAPSTLSGIPYFTQGLGGVSSSDIAITRPSFDRNGGGVSSSENGSWGSSRGNGRHVSVPVYNKTNDQMRPFQQLGLSTTPMKRGEPDGGWDSCQLGLRQMTS